MSKIIKVPINKSDKVNEIIIEILKLSIVAEEV